jgi:hypothetical protein
LAAFALLLLAAAAPATFPERVPVMVEACVQAAVADEAVSDEEGSYKYICSGEPAETLSAWLEQAKIEPWEQDTKTEGRWLGRPFPLGACFKQLLKPDGSPGDGLSCTIWVPHPAPVRDEAGPAR